MPTKKTTAKKATTKKRAAFHDEEGRHRQEGRARDQDRDQDDGREARTARDRPLDDAQGDRRRHRPRRNRVSGTTTHVIDGAHPEAAKVFKKADVAVDNSTRWYAMCADHGSVTIAGTRRQAHRLMSDPSGWCHACRDAVE